MIMLSEKTLGEVRRSTAKRILLQVPEGLKIRVQEIAEEFERTGVEVLIGCDPCFGACDIRGDEARRLGCDLIVHVGHSDLDVRSSVPVLYEYYPLKADVEGMLEKNTEKIKPFKKIGLVTSLQYVNLLEDVKRTLQKGGFEIHIKKNKISGVEGQILGCEHSAALDMEKEVDCFLFVGTGRFHPLGLAAVTEKPVFFLDVEADKIFDLREGAKKEKIKKGLKLEKARGCKKFGILVSTKPGQARPEEALKIKRLLEKKGKKAWILTMDRITPEKIMGIKVDCLVNTACPRLAEDSGMFGKLILNAEDAGTL